MLNASVPTKFPIPFAASAPVSDIRAIPTTPGPVPGAAALTTGFPPLTFIQPSVGGIPPDGRDVNGILNQVTSWDQWAQAGGPVGYDAAFATSIGGYPRGALISSATGHAWYECLVDGNLTNPNASGANWRVAFCVWSAQSWQATGSANAQNITLSPAPTSLAQLIGIPIHFFSQGTSTGPVTLNVNALGAVSFLQGTGVQLGAGALGSGGSYTARYNGIAFFLTSLTGVFSDASTAGVAVSGVGNAAGAGLALLGNGGTTPNKYIRARGGVLEFINSAYSAVIATLTDLGAFTISSSMTAGGPITATTGNITAGTGRIRAALGAFGTGDPAVATILSDFTLITNANGSAMRWPNGVMVQMGVKIPPTGNGDIVNMPTTFPTGAFASSSTDDGPLMADTAIGVLNNSQIQLWCGYNNNGVPIYVGGSVGVVWTVWGT